MNISSFALLYCFSVFYFLILFFLFLFFSGNCKERLRRGESCVAACAEGFVLEGVTSCSDKAVLTRSTSCVAKPELQRKYYVCSGSSIQCVSEDLTKAGTKLNLLGGQHMIVEAINGQIQDGGMSGSKYWGVTNPHWVGADSTEKNLDSKKMPVETRAVKAIQNGAYHNDDAKMKLNKHWGGFGQINQCAQAASNLCGGGATGKCSQASMSEVELAKSC